MMVAPGLRILTVHARVAALAVCGCCLGGWTTLDMQRVRRVLSAGSAAGAARRGPPESHGSHGLRPGNQTGPPTKVVFLHVSRLIPSSSRWQVPRCRPRLARVGHDATSHNRIMGYRVQRAMTVPPTPRTRHGLTITNVAASISRIRNIARCYGE